VHWLAKLNGNIILFDGFVYCFWILLGDALYNVMAHITVWIDRPMEFII